MGIISSLMDNPREFIIFMLLALPGRLMAISLHEFGHAWVANRCGDPTARLMGRMTVNPLKHIDLLGLLMMLFVGIGWAKPVPVNPLNFRNYRSDDLKVSLAGVTMNFLLFLVSTLVMFAMVGAALSRVPTLTPLQTALTREPVYITTYAGEQALLWEEDGGLYYNSLSAILANAPWAGDVLIRPVFGTVAGYVYQMLGYFVVVNIMLAIFNLIPVPPLDGYHVLNDLVLKRSLFADQKAQLVGMGLMYALLFTGYLSKGLGAAQGFIFDYLGKLALSAFRMLGIL